MRTRERSKGEILNLLKKQTNIRIKARYNKKDLHAIAERNNIPVTIEEHVIEPGWVGSAKGLLQVLWERGWIDVAKLGEYSINGKKTKWMKMEKSNRNTKGMSYVP